MSAKPLPIGAVIFDMDGVLADSRAALLRAWRQTFGKFGVHIDKPTLRSLVIGVVDYDAISAYIRHNHPGPVDPKKVISTAEAHYLAIMPSVIRYIPGVRTVVRRLQRLHLPLALVTSAQSKTMSRVLRALRFDRTFVCCISADDVAHRKPHPEGYQVASRKLCIPPACCLVLEDSPKGILAAKKSGMACVALETSYPAAQLREADIVIRSFAAFPWAKFAFAQR